MLHENIILSYLRFLMSFFYICVNILGIPGEMLVHWVLADAVSSWSSTVGSPFFWNYIDIFPKIVPSYFENYLQVFLEFPLVIFLDLYFWILTIYLPTVSNYCLIFIKLFPYIPIFLPFILSFLTNFRQRHLSENFFLEFQKSLI